MELVEHLRGVDTTSVPALAQALSVSPRTIQRDLATLRARGLPVISEAGPGGGVCLKRARGVSAVHLSLAEVVTLWLSAQIAQKTSALPWSSAARSGQAKLLSALPPQRARQLRALQKRVVVGPPASALVQAQAKAPPPQLLQLFEEAFFQSCALRFSYTDRAGQRTRRTVEPHGLLVQSPVWYILARDVAKDAARMFRMDRVSMPRLQPEHRFSPDPQIITTIVDPPHETGAPC